MRDRLVTMQRGICYPLVLVLFHLFVVTVHTETVTDTDVENVLRTLFEPNDAPSIQIKSLRRDILRRIYDALDRRDPDYDDDQLLEYKRSMSSLARWGNLPPKRNIQSLARGYFLRNPLRMTGSGTEEGGKRSISTMAKNGQLPHKRDSGESDVQDSVSRDELEALLEELYEKRNIGSLARNYNYPSYGKRYLGSLARGNNVYRYEGKRNIASLARGGIIAGKRNVAALLRQDSYMNAMQNQDDGHTARPQIRAGDDHDEKRNLASVKAHFKKRSVPVLGSRVKRELDYYDVSSDEYATPVYQNQNVLEYEELMKALTGEYPETEKRFLGSVARSGWFRQQPDRFRTIEKRHIGALARLGWLPTLRTVRRFNRSGRTAAEDCDCDTTRTAASNGKTEDNYIAKNALPLTDNKRFLLQPAVDKILLEKVYMTPRTQ